MNAISAFNWAIAASCWREKQYQDVFATSMTIAGLGLFVPEKYAHAPLFVRSNGEKLLMQFMRNRSIHLNLAAGLVGYFSGKKIMKI